MDVLGGHQKDDLDQAVREIAVGARRGPGPVRIGNKRLGNGLAALLTRLGQQRDDRFAHGKLIPLTR